MGRELGNGTTSKIETHGWVKPNKHSGFDKFKIGGLSIKLFIRVSPLYVLKGCPQNYLSKYVHYLFWRVVHKTIYRSKSTICIGGLSTNLFIRVCPQFISEGCPKNYLSK